MPNRPSFLNLDEAKNDMLELESRMQSNISNFENQTVQQTRNAINSIEGELKRLENALKSQDMLNPLSEQLKQTVELFKQFRDAGMQAINVQKSEIQSFMDKIVQMDEALKKSNDSIEKLGSANIGNTAAVDEYIRKINDLKLSFDNMVSTSDIINLDEADLDAIKSKITNFLSHLSRDGMQAFNLANMMMQSASDPAVETAFKEMLRPLNQLISEIPQNVIDSFNKGTQGVEMPNLGLGNVAAQNPSLQQLTDALTTLTGKIDKVDQGTGYTLYNENVAQAERRFQDELNYNVANEREFNRLWEHVGRINVSNEQAKFVDSNLEKSRNNISNADKQIENIVDMFKKGSYTNKEKSAMEQMGINDDSVLGLREHIFGAEKLYNNYSVKSRGLQNSIGGYSNALENFNKDSSIKNLEALLDAEKNVELQAFNASKALNELFTYQNQFMSNLRLEDNDAFKELPKEMQELLISMNNIFEDNNNSAESLLKLYRSFNLQLDDSAKTLETVLSNAQENINAINLPDSPVSNSGETDIFKTIKDSKFVGVLGLATTGLKSFNDGLEKSNRMLNQLGLGVGMPMSLNGLTGFVKDTTKWHREFGVQSYENALAQVNQGGNINDSLIDYSINKGIDLQRATHGRVQYSEYSDILNSLITNVQGHYGDSNKERAQQDMNEMSGMGLMLQKIYGVDSTNAIGTFYKELRMGTSETIDLLGRLTENAQMANIPVNQYIKTISELGIKFKDLGFDLKLVENGMRNLTLNGMSMSNATNFVSQTGGTMDKFTNNLGQMGYYGVMSGAFSDPYEAMSTMMLRWDENGNEIGGSGDAILSSIGAKVDMYSAISGGNENLQKAMVFRTLSDMGYDDKNSSMLTQRYFNGDFDGFKELIDDIFKEGDGEGTTEQELQDKLVSATEHLDELTKAEQQMISTQQDIAKINKDLYDSIGKNWQAMITAFENVATGTSKLISSNSLLQSTLSNLPMLMMGTSLLQGALSMGGGALLKKGGNSLFNWGKSLFKGGAGDDVLDATFEVVEKSAKGASKAAASSADDVAGAIAKGVASGADDALKGFGKYIPYVGAALTVLEAGTEYTSNRKKGKDVGESALDTGAVVGGSLGGGAIGAAIGSAILPGIGTAIGAGLGGMIGNWAADWGVNKWDENKNKRKNTDPYSLENKVNYSSINNETKSVEYNLASAPSSSATNGLKKDTNKLIESSLSNTAKSSEEMVVKQKQLSEQYQTSRDILSKENHDIVSQLRSIDNTIDSSVRKIENAISRNNSSKSTSLKRPSIFGTNNNSSILESNSNGTILDGTTSSSGILSPLNNKNNSILQNNGISSRSIADFGVGDVIHKDLSQKTNLTAADIDEWISSNASSNSKMQGMGSAFLKASEESGLDPLYLVAHAALETGWGTSSILNDKNNWFGIGAFDSSPYESAYGFNNLEAGIIEGAKWISRNYTQQGQNTLHSMRFNNGVHEYATDPEWANKIGSIMLGGVGGDTTLIGAHGSGSLGGGDSSFSSSLSWDDLQSGKYNNYKFSSYVLGMGSPEYSNGAQSYDPTKYKEYDKDFVYYDSQAMARKQYLSYYGDSIDSSEITSARDDRSTAYNQSPQFKVNINVTGENTRSVNYDNMANDVKVALSNIAEQYMGASARITSASYQRQNANY